MQLYEAALLGVIQGATEFLPISSSGHLILAEAFWRIRAGLAFDAFIHLGTLGAVIFYFRKDWWEVLKGFQGPGFGRRLLGMLLLGTLPGALAGLLLEEVVSTHFRDPHRVALMLLIMSLPLVLGEVQGRKNRDLRSLRMFEAFLIGMAQALALIPGTSRSGITMAAGLLLGLSRASAAHFSFLLSAPIIAGAGLFEGLKVLSSGGGEPLPMIVGALSAFFSGWVAISFLLRFLKTHTFYPFVIYRILLALGVYAVF